MSEDARVIRFPTERVSAPQDRSGDSARVVSLHEPFNKAMPDMIKHAEEHERLHPEALYNHIERNFPEDPLPSLPNIVWKVTHTGNGIFSAKCGLCGQHRLIKKDTE